MKIFGFDFSITKAAKAEAAPVTNPGEVSAYSYSDETNVISNSGWLPMRSYGFNGEKTPGALGKPVNLVPDADALRARSYEMLLNNDTIKTIAGPYFKWVNGSGLKLQAQPNETALKYEGITEDFETLRAKAEAYWQLYAESSRSDYSGMQSLHENFDDAFCTTFSGGDVLHVLRVDEQLNLTVQVIDGQHIKQPLLNSDFFKFAEKAGNRIVKGIELSPTRKHVAFYVLKDQQNSLMPEFERIPAYGPETGCRMAWIEYGLKHRIDHVRGIPELTPTFEKVKKLDRYTEATISSAEERAKIPLFIKHGSNSTGENPMEAHIKKNMRINDGVVSGNSYLLGEALSKKIAATEEKTVYNMPVDSELKAISSDSEINYEPLWKSIFIQASASAGVPPEVALRQYNSNYVASRAAIMAWSHEVNIRRKKHASYSYQKTYELWFFIQVLKNKIQAAGYLKAYDEGNFDVMESYTTARWAGAIMPHVDPAKEIKFAREVLGDPSIGEQPLASYQQMAEQLGLGEWEENFKEYQKEQKLVPPLPATAVPAQPGETLVPEKVTV